MCTVGERFMWKKSRGAPEPVSMHLAVNTNKPHTAHPKGVMSGTFLDLPDLCLGPHLLFPPSYSFTWSHCQGDQSELSSKV